MKIAITGAGAMGSAFAFFLNRAHVEFVIYEKDGETVRSIEGDGITAELEGNETAFHVTISSDPEIISDCDLILVLVKSYSTGELIKAIGPFIKKGAVILSLQNGLGNRETIAAGAAGVPVLAGTTTVGAAKISQSRVKISGIGDVTVEEGEYSEKIGSLFSAAGLGMVFSCNVEKILYEKAVINSAINPLGAMFSMKNGELIKNSSCLSLMDSIIEEITSLPEVIACSIESETMKDRVRRVCEITSENRCSMLQDLSRGRQTEIDFINGHFEKLGSMHSMEMKVNSTIVLCIRILEERANSLHLLNTGFIKN